MFEDQRFLGALNYPSLRVQKVPQLFDKPRKSLGFDNFGRVLVPKKSKIAVRESLVLLLLKICSLKKSQSQNKQKIDSRKSLSLDNFY